MVNEAVLEKILAEIGERCDGKRQDGASAAPFGVQSGVELEEPSLDGLAREIPEYPVMIHSDVLGKVIWLAGSDGEAEKLQAEGKVAYSPREIDILKEKTRGLTDEEADEKLRRWNSVKEILHGKIIE